MMTPIIFNYVLPMVLGYTIFVAIAGQYIPFRRPRTPAGRPLWFLGHWVGMALAIFVAAGSVLPYRLDLNQLSVLVVPGLVAFLGALLIGFIGYVWLRMRAKREMSEHAESQPLNSDEPIDSDQPEHVADALLHQESCGTQLTESDIESVESTLTTNIEDQSAIWAKNSDNLAISELGLDETLSIDVDPTDANEPTLINAVETPAEIDTENSADINSEAVSEFDSETVAKTDAKALTEPDSELTYSEAQHDAITDDETDEFSAIRQENNRLRDELEAEIESRKELETHFRIIRSGLGELESESRGFESNKAAALIKMEQELEEKVKRTAAAEARAGREAAKRVELENQVVQLREDTLRATTDSRVSTEARVKALSTANKATTFARQAIQIRARLETQLGDAKEEIDGKQATISSLIKALEKEKSRTQEEVASMAKQLRLHEKQLQARRTLEEVSRSVDNKLSTRLVKKVAKSRG